jgi:CheY-like chemotaxis protein
MLVVDDEPGDAWLAVRDSPYCAWQILTARENSAAVEHLRVLLRWGADALPDLILLDYSEINDSVEILVAIRKEPWLAHIPVLVLTRDAVPGDWRQLYRHGANVVYSRPSDVEGLECLLGAIVDHWQTVVAVPVDPAA